MKKRLLIIGGHGSGEIAMSIFEDANRLLDEWNLVGYLSDIKKPGQYLGKHKIIGTTDEIEEFVNKGYYIHNTLFFSVKDKINRVERFRKMKIPLEANATGIHPTAVITPGVEIGCGVLINQYSLAQINCKVENFVHVYSVSLIGHDSHVHHYCTIGAHSIVGGRVVLKEGVHIGLNACIREDIKIGKYAIIGLGSVVINDVEDLSVAVGNPAKIVKKIR